MFSHKPRRPRGDGNGISWFVSGTSTPVSVNDVFGPRPFNAHVATVGYNYDFHRGIDGPPILGDNIHATINGDVIRSHHTHYHWDSPNQLRHWTEIDTHNVVAFEQNIGFLTLSGTRAGNREIPDVGYIHPKNERLMLTGSNWIVEMNLSGTISSNGCVGIGVLNVVSATEFVGLEYNGITFTTTGSDSNGKITGSDTTSIASGKSWFRIEFESGSKALSWKHSEDGATYTTIASSNAITFTSGGLTVGLPIIYWRSTDTNAALDYINIKQFNWVDDQTIGRFGNWLTIGDATRTTLMYHMQDLSVTWGDRVSAGQILGTTGLTGFDTRSGRIINPHVHFEWMDRQTYFYDNDWSINPLSPGLLPRADVTTNVSVTRSLSADPDSLTSYLLAITSSRNNQDFDINYIALTGSLGARAINWNNRSGLNADTDIPKNNGVYIVPEVFDINSADYRCAIFFSTASVGTFSAAVIKDAAGNTLWSE